MVRSGKDFSHEMRFLKKELVRQDQTVIECGAHHGAQSILLSHWVGSSGKVLALEPIPENLRIQKTNVELNHLTNVVVIGKAAGPNCDRVPMNSDSNGSVRIKGKNTLDIECITLDELSNQLKITPTFVKIDVEGFECKVLEGSQSILSKVPALFVEIHTLTLPRYGNRFEDLWELVNPKYYDIFIQAEDTEEPVPYNPSHVPQGRVHLFFRPR